MYYYIRTSSWNLLESFVSESISPFSFYQDRGYGNNLSRYIDGTNERTDYLILSTKEIKGDYVLKVNDEILDKSSIVPVKNCKGVYTYGKTIYYKKGAVTFLFSSKDSIDAFISESQILFEVKCVCKYQSDFIVNKGKVYPLPTDKITNTISFNRYEYVAQDGVYDKLKGAIVAYTHAIALSASPEEQHLISLLRELKNSFAGLNTQIMVSGVAVSDENKYVLLVEKVKDVYCRTVEKQTNLFDILLQQFYEIVKLARARAVELSKNEQVCSKIRIKELQARMGRLESELHDIEFSDGVSDLVEELNSIKIQERKNGAKKGKKREYFKEGTREFERKKYLKNEIEKRKDNNGEYKSIKKNISNIKQQITSIEKGVTVYDTTLGALFVRVSDIMNDLVGKAKVSCEICNRVDYECMSLKNSKLYVDACVSVEEKVFLNIIINEALKNEKRVLSDEVVLNLIVESANQYKCMECASSENGKMILDTLREFWAYKHNQRASFSIPDKLIAIKSLMSFFVKPFGFDQMERYAQNKGIERMEFGFMLRGALIGFIAIPKTFTDALYTNKDLYMPLDEYLAVIHRQVEEQFCFD